MSSRSFYIAGIASLGVAVFLGLLTSISLPTLPAIDFVRVSFDNVPQSADFMAQLRYGIWAPCVYDGNGKRTCVYTGHGYPSLIRTLDSSGKEIKSVLIGSSWTRGLAIHPVATVFTAIALGFACSKHEHGPILATLSSLIAAFLMLLAFIVDIALFAFVKQQVGTLPNGHTSTSAAFWMAFVSLILVIVAGGAVFFGRRRETDSSYPTYSSSSGGGFLSRFRKN
ncbi:hypothetical protein B0H19DRAFT_1145975 [Mycena capillaripes]|nr:hypothetical protein B0H19DRAFT_1145975 [Mycena capillaripes]